jgi:hypothetical protein
LSLVVLVKLGRWTCCPALHGGASGSAEAWESILGTTTTDQTWTPGALDMKIEDIHISPGYATDSVTGYFIKLI